MLHSNYVSSLTCEEPTEMEDILTGGHHHQDVNNVEIPNDF
jgi:hypothetical protein